MDEEQKALIVQRLTQAADRLDRSCPYEFTGAGTVRSAERESAAADMCDTLERYAQLVTSGTWRGEIRRRIGEYQKAADNARQWQANADQAAAEILVRTARTCADAIDLFMQPKPPRRDNSENAAKDETAQTLIDTAAELQSGLRLFLIGFDEDQARRWKKAASDYAAAVTRAYGLVPVWAQNELPVKWDTEPLLYAIMSKSWDLEKRVNEAVASAAVLASMLSE